MKKTYLLIACMSIQFVIHAQNKNLKMDTLSYSLGVLIANNLKQQGFDKLSAPDLVEAIEDVLQGKRKSMFIKQMLICKLLWKQRLQKKMVE
ncbi:MAG: hypothetical protein IPJ43_18160 [Saprospiraceae bacterium]|nr:hypothetical protein [Saprospiraceae bacterium]